MEDSSYLVQASLLICDLGVSDECDKMAHKSKEIMNRLNREHPVLTSTEDTSSAVLDTALSPDEYQPVKYLLE